MACFGELPLSKILVAITGESLNIDDVRAMIAKQKVQKCSCKNDRLLKWFYNFVNYRIF